MHELRGTPINYPRNRHNICDQVKGQVVKRRFSARASRYGWWLLFCACPSSLMPLYFITELILWDPDLCILWNASDSKNILFVVSPISSKLSLEIFLFSTSLQISLSSCKTYAVTETWRPGPLPSQLKARRPNEWRNRYFDYRIRSMLSRPHVVTFLPSMVIQDAGRLTSVSVYPNSVKGHAHQFTPIT